MQCIVVTPETTVVDEPVEFVALPLYDGEIGIAPGHSPLIGRMGFGELRLRGPMGAKWFYVEGGFVQVHGDVVSVLSPRVIPADQVDVAAARKALHEAVGRTAHSPELVAARERAVGQARAQIRVGQHAGV